MNGHIFPHWQLAGSGKRLGLRLHSGHAATSLGLLLFFCISLILL